MHTLRRNQQTIKYKNWVGESAIVDASGNETGEYSQTYDATATSQRVYVTANQGTASETMFGESLDYDKLIIVDKTTINEYSILWVDDLDTTHPYDYKVVKVAKSLNSYAIAIKKVRV